jgi:CheY-like chemotaxis protein
MRDRALIVEDNDDMRDLLQEVLEDAGYETLVAANGRQELAHIEKESQLLHLNARTRCRWSLRFQVSYLTLLLRRTNRSGPVDFLPRIFAEVTAHRHQVMPHGD